MDNQRVKEVDHECYVSGYLQEISTYTHRLSMSDLPTSRLPHYEFLFMVNSPLVVASQWVARQM